MHAQTQLMRLKYKENKPMPATTNNWNQSIKKKKLCILLCLKSRNNILLPKVANF
jgi:hypothetical protein